MAPAEEINENNSTQVVNVKQKDQLNNEGKNIVKYIQVDLSLLVQNHIKSSHYLDQAWESFGYLF